MPKQQFQFKGQEELQRNLEKVAQDTIAKRDKGLFEAGSMVMRRSREEVPHDKGTLQKTGKVTVVENNAVLSYDTKYAVRLHENPQFNFQKGRKGKYLEDPIKNNQQAVLQILADALSI